MGEERGCFSSSGIPSASFFASLQNRSWWNTAGTPRVPCFPPHPPFVSINHDPAEFCLENRQVLLHPLSRSVHPCPQLFLLHLRLILVHSDPASSGLSSFSQRLACARSPLSAFLCGFAVFFRLVFFFLPFRPTASPRALPASSARLYFWAPRRNCRVLRFASGLSVGPTGGPSWKPF